MKKKIHRIHLRLSEEEYLLLKKKTQKYPSMSGLIIHAVEAFDERGGVNKIDVLNDWAEKLKEFKYEVNRVGNNLNQITRYVNQLKQQGLYSEGSMIFICKQLEEYIRIMRAVRDGQDRVNEKLIRSKL